MAFETTQEGYLEAKKYLEDKGLLWEISKEQSVDGYTVVYFANTILEKEGENHGEA